jgi:heat shock protein HslJ
VERESPLPPARLSPETIGERVWRLEAWDVDVAAAPEPAVTLSWRAGRLAGHSGCNRYSAAVTAGESPGDITMGPTIGTRMACPPLAMEVERRFLQALGSTRKIGFHAGRLALTFVTEQGMGTMLFAPDTAAHADSASATP